MLKFLHELVVEEEMQHVGPCGTCGAIRVGAVSALFAPNAKRRWREHRGPSAFMIRRMGVGSRRVPVCERDGEHKVERQRGI